MTNATPENEPDPDQTSGSEASEGPSGFGGAETSAGGADAVPETPDNVPDDGSYPPL